VRSIPVREIARICRNHNLWLHVDAAMSGTAALCSRVPFHSRWRGIRRQLLLQSATRWMFTNFDCNVFYVADRKHLIQTLSVLPEYLRNQATESGAVIDYRDWHIQLGRLFVRSRLWFVIRHTGSKACSTTVREHVRWPRNSRPGCATIRASNLSAPAQVNLVCFRLCAQIV